MVFNFIKSTWWQLKGFLFPTCSKKSWPGGWGNSVSGLFWFDICKQIMNYFSSPRSILIKGGSEIRTNLWLSLSPGTAWSATRHWGRAQAAGRHLGWGTSTWANIYIEKYYWNIYWEILDKYFTWRPARSYGFLCPVWTRERLALERSVRGSKGPPGGISGALDC